MIHSRMLGLSVVVRCELDERAVVRVGLRARDAGGNSSKLVRRTVRVRR